MSGGNQFSPLDNPVQLPQTHQMNHARGGRGKPAYSAPPPYTHQPASTKPLHADPMCGGASLQPRQPQRPLSCTADGKKRVRFGFWSGGGAKLSPTVEAIMASYNVTREERCVPVEMLSVPLETALWAIAELATCGAVDVSQVDVADICSLIPTAFLQKAADGFDKHGVFSFLLPIIEFQTQSKAYLLCSRIVASVVTQHREATTVCAFEKCSFAATNKNMCSALLFLHLGKNAVSFFNYCFKAGFYNSGVGVHLFEIHGPQKFGCRTVQPCLYVPKQPKCAPVASWSALFATEKFKVAGATLVRGIGELSVFGRLRRGEANVVELESTDTAMVLASVNTLALATKNCAVRCDLLKVSDTGVCLMHFTKPSEVEKFYSFARQYNGIVLSPDPRIDNRVSSTSLRFQDKRPSSAAVILSVDSDRTKFKDDAFSCVATTTGDKIEITLKSYTIAPWANADFFGLFETATPSDDPFALFELLKKARDLAREGKKSFSYCHQARAPQPAVVMEARFEGIAPTSQGTGAQKFAFQLQPDHSFYLALPSHSYDALKQAEASCTTAKKEGMSSLINWRMTRKEDVVVDAELTFGMVDDYFHHRLQSLPQKVQDTLEALRLLRSNINPDEVYPKELFCGEILIDKDDADAPGDVIQCQLRREVHWRSRKISGSELTKEVNQYGCEMDAPSGITTYHICRMVKRFQRYVAFEALRKSRNMCICGTRFVESTCTEIEPEELAALKKYVGQVATSRKAVQDMVEWNSSHVRSCVTSVHDILAAINSGRVVTLADGSKKRIFDANSDNSEISFVCQTQDLEGLRHRWVAASRIAAEGDSFANSDELLQRAKDLAVELSDHVPRDFPSLQRRARSLHCYTIIREADPSKPLRCNVSLVTQFMLVANPEVGTPCLTKFESLLRREEKELETSQFERDFFPNFDFLTQPLSLGSIFLEGPQPRVMLANGFVLNHVDEKTFRAEIYCCQLRSVVWCNVELLAKEVAATEVPFPPFSNVFITVEAVEGGAAKKQLVPNVGNEDCSLPWNLTPAPEAADCTAVLTVVDPLAHGRHEMAFGLSFKAFPSLHGALSGSKGAGFHHSQREVILRQEMAAALLRLQKLSPTKEN